VHTKRWGKNKAKNEFYIDWKDIEYIRFKTPLSKNSSPAIDIVSRVFGNGYYNVTMLSYSKFASLAIYYSGRKDIIYREYKKIKKPNARSLASTRRIGRIVFIAKFIWHTEKHLKMQIHAINQKQSVHLK
jgi:hypothetical protein